MTKRQKIYLEAAERVDCAAEQFSCNAIGRIELGAPNGNARTDDPADTPLRTRYVEVMLDGDSSPISARMLDDYMDGDGITNFRVLLLCMMAAACEDL